MSIIDILGDSDQPPRRPAYERDHLWLKWQLEEGLGPAKIRDQWDAMRDAERKAISPNAWERVGGDDSQAKKAGREVVKTALGKAKKERRP
jgi:predicted Rossmann fold nucleotide-binding protein DprA/Smf involved in DNA uptake